MEPRQSTTVPNMSNASTLYWFIGVPQRWQDGCHKVEKKGQLANDTHANGDAAKGKGREPRL
jgi:hypothetical protein